MKKYKYCLRSVMIGDYCGSPFEGYHGQLDASMLTDENLLYNTSTRPNRITDDSICTLAVASTIMTSEFDWEGSIKKFASVYPEAGYGSLFKQWLYNLIPSGYGSWSNGAAMRCSPIAWYASDIEECDRLIEESCQCTHNSEIAIKGAKCLARAIYYAKHGEDKEFIRRNTVDEFFPEWKGVTIDDYIQHFKDKGDDVDTYDWYMRCDHIVCMCILAFEVSESWEHALYIAIAQGFDTDTAGVIVSPLAYAYYGEIPEKYIEAVSRKLSLETETLDEVFSSKFVF